MATTPSDESRLRIRLVRGEGRAAVATGLPVLDHLLEVLADWGRFDLELDETAPDGRRGGGRSGRTRARRRRRTAPHGAWVRLGDRAGRRGARAGRARGFRKSRRRLERRPLGRARRRSPRRPPRALLLEELCAEAGLTLHVRLLEGEDARHVSSSLQGAGLALGPGLRSENRGLDLWQEASEFAPTPRRRPFQARPYSQASTSADSYSSRAGFRWIRRTGELVGEHARRRPSGCCPETSARSSRRRDQLANLVEQ